MDVTIAARADGDDHQGQSACRPARVPSPSRQLAAGRRRSPNARGRRPARPRPRNCARRHVLVRRRRAGRYIVKADHRTRPRRRAPNAPTQWAAADVTVSGQDLDVPLTLQPGVAINGRVVFEGAQPTAAELQTLSFLLRAAGIRRRGSDGGGGRVDAEGRFTFPASRPIRIGCDGLERAGRARQVGAQDLRRERPRGVRGAASREPEERSTGPSRSPTSRPLSPVSSRIAPAAPPPTISSWSSRPTAGTGRRARVASARHGRRPTARSVSRAFRRRVLTWPRSRTSRPANGTTPRCSSSSYGRRSRSRCATARRRPRISASAGSGGQVISRAAARPGGRAWVMELVVDREEIDGNERAWLARGLAAACVLAIAAIRAAQTTTAPSLERSETGRVASFLERL